MSFVLDRIKIQNQQAKVTLVPVPVEIKHNNPHVSPEELKKALMEHLVAEPAPTIVQDLGEKRFDDIYNFVDWYLKNIHFFSTGQNNALKTLVDARKMIENGCNCKRKQRERAAFDYFKNFWEKNKDNDILPTLLKASGAKKIHIGNFIAYPTL